MVLVLTEQSATLLMACWGFAYQYVHMGLCVCAQSRLDCSSIQTGYCGDGKLVRKFEPTNTDMHSNFIAVMRSRRISGRQAFDWGVATDCVPDAELEQATDALVDELRSFSPLAQRTAKKLLNDTEDSPLSIAIELEGHCYSRLRSSEDFREGVEAFHSKRKPNFVGR
jgi:enoyl-CoA hydratase/carnithine racemase